MPVEHEPQKHRFVVHTPEGEAFLTYSERDERTLDLQHTVVSAPARGQGLGEELARSALDYARLHGRRVVPTCHFVATYIEKNPEYADLVADGAAR
jgi:uncharacterized protein